MTNNNHPLNADFEATVSTRRVGLLLQRIFQDPAWYEIAERLYRQTYSEAFVAYLSCRQQPLWDPVNLEKDFLETYLMKAATKDRAIEDLLKLLSDRGEIAPIWLDQEDPHDQPPVVDVVALWEKLPKDFYFVEGLNNWFVFRRESRTRK